MDGQVFLYRAFGIAFGGNLTRPFRTPVNGQAATALPITGGYASSRIDGYSKDGLAFKSAHTYITGNRADDGSYNTAVTATIEGLNIFSAVTADVITARVSSRHPDGEGEPEIVTVGSEFVNLRVGGVPVIAPIDHEVGVTLATYSALQKRAAADQSFVQSKKGITRVSLVRGLKLAEGAPFTLEGSTIRVPQVGVLYLGELYVSPYARRLTMLRLELGSPFAGQIVCAEAETNGTTYP